MSARSSVLGGKDAAVGDSRLASRHPGLIEHSLPDVEPYDAGRAAPGNLYCFRARPAAEIDDNFSRKLVPYPLPNSTSVLLRLLYALPSR